MTYLNKTITVRGERYKLSISENKGHFDAKIYNVQLSKFEEDFQATTTFTSPKSLQSELINWVKFIVGQRDKASGVFEEINEWDGVIE